MLSQRLRILALTSVTIACVNPNPAFGGLQANGEGESGESEEETGESGGESAGGESGEPGETEDDTDTSDDGASESDSGGDGDGDPGGDGDGDEPLACGAPAAYADCDLTPAGLTDDPFRALGLGCEGPADETVDLSYANFEVIDNDSWRIASHFGVAPGPNADGWMWAPQDAAIVPGEDELPDTLPNTTGAMLVLSTGLLPPVDAQGGVVLEPGAQVSYAANLNEGALELPAPLSPARGSNAGLGGTPFVDCDGVNDCSDSLYEQWFIKGWNELHDRLWLRVRLEVPEGVHGYMFDFAFFSSEYPQYIDTQYNDMFIAWMSSSTYTGTLTFVDEAPMNTTSLAQVDGFPHTGEDAELAGTGFEGHAATGWLLARGPAVPGETVDITFYLSDLGDEYNSSVVLLDNFRWDCGGCMGADCGFE